MNGLRPLVGALLLIALATIPANASWPQFRGPAGDGRALAADLPITWSESENVAWKVAIPGRGWSSPIVADGKVWLTTAVEEERSLRALAIDAASSRVVHDIEVFQPTDWEFRHPENSYASPTPVAEEGRVYVHFGAYGTACLDVADGRPIWKSAALELDHEHGPGSSPIPWKDFLIVNCDGADQRFVATLEKATGELAWRTARSLPPSSHGWAFSTPKVITHAGRTQLVSPAAGLVGAYDPANGKEIWRIKAEGYSTVPRPVAGLGMVFVTTGYMKPKLLAIRLDGRGDVTRSHVAWSYHWQVPANPSLLLIGDRLYMVSDWGIASWLDARLGKDLWRQRLDGRYFASPLYARGRIYNFDTDGRSRVIAAADDYQELAYNQLDGQIRASPAVDGDALILRTETHLYRIEERDSEP